MPTYLHRSGSGDDALHGPFRGPVLLGSDADRCQLVVEPQADIRPVHATLGPFHAGQHTLAPANPDCRVYLQPPGTDTVWEVDCPVSAKVGATLYLGSKEGPAFVIQQGNPAGERPLPEPEAMDMMGALDRALGEQVRALDGDSAKPADKDPKKPVEVPTEALPRRPARHTPAPMFGCLLAGLSGMLFGGLAFGTATFAVLRALGTAG